MTRNDPTHKCTVLGIGNVLMGDEGIGVHALRRLETTTLPPGVLCVDGGTGGFHLLGHLQDAPHVILIDATLDDQPPGTIQRLTPRFSSDYPQTLTAHDIGLKDLLDALYLLGHAPTITLFTITIRKATIGADLSEPVRNAIPILVDRVRTELT